MHHLIGYDKARLDQQPPLAFNHRQQGVTALNHKRHRPYLQPNPVVPAQQHQIAQRFKPSIPDHLLRPHLLHLAKTQGHLQHQRQIHQQAPPQNLRHLHLPKPLNKTSHQNIVIHPPHLHLPATQRRLRPNQTHHKLTRTPHRVHMPIGVL